MPEAIVCRFCDRGICQNSFKNCPHCSEMVWTTATYCRYCKSTIGEGNAWGSPFGKKSARANARATGKIDEKTIEKIFDNVMKEN